jgi:ketosteroid isomerase-like protein
MLRRALFRSVNEQVARVNKRHDTLERAALSLFCECGSPDCEARVELTRAAYERARAHRARFVLKTEHASPEFERLVEEVDGCVVVERSDSRLDDLLESFDSGAPDR